MSYVANPCVCVCSQKRNLKAQILGQKGKHGDKYRKKLEEQEVAYWVASPSLPLRLYGRAGKVKSSVCNTPPPHTHLPTPLTLTTHTTPSHTHSPHTPPPHTLTSHTHTHTLPSSNSCLSCTLRRREKPGCQPSRSCNQKVRVGVCVSLGGRSSR